MAREDVPMWVKVAIGVVLFALTIGTTVGGLALALGKDSATHDYVVDSLLKTDIRHDKLILQNTENITSVEKTQHKADIARIKLEGKIDLFVAGQKATTKEITEMKDEFKDFTEYLMQFNYDKKKDTE
jgi:hypothetical protein